MVSVEVVAPSNIALVKYWGKHPDYPDLFIPTKSSVSFNIDAFRTKTRLKVRKGKGAVRLKLNGRRIAADRAEFSYLSGFFSRMQSRYRFARDYDYDIESRNNFPTAAGFASSASGLSALAVSFARAMREERELPSLDDREVSIIARLGSGSAARSAPSRGGLVIWHRGYDNARNATQASESSFAETLYGPRHFSDLELICITAWQGAKKTKSRAGMDESVKSVYDYWQWVEHEEEVLLPSVLSAAKRRDWESLFGLVKQASNNFHSLCLRTSPPIVYLNDVSRRIIEAIEPMKFAAYTFDAGPNAVVITLKERAREASAALEKIVGGRNLVVSSIGAGPIVE